MAHTTARRSRGANKQWILLLSVFIINVLVPSMVLSYGIILASSVKNGNSDWIVFLCPTVYCVIFFIIQSWCREAADSWGGNNGYRFMASIGLVMASCGVLLCTFTPVFLHPLFYGGMGGLGGALIAAQIEAILFDNFDTRLGMVRGLCYAGQALGQFILPHIFLLLIETYGITMSYLVQSAVILQTLPAIMMLRSDDNYRRSRHQSGYSSIFKSYSMFNNDTSNYNYENDLQLNDLKCPKTWRSPSDDNLHRHDEEGESNYVVEDTTETPPPSPEERRKNIYGVEILPEIPEESEISDNSDSDTSVDNNKKKRFSAALKRLSIMSDSFDESIERYDRRNSAVDPNAENATKYTEIEVIYSNVSPATEVKRERTLDRSHFKTGLTITSIKRSLRVPSYKMYRIKRRLTFILYSLNDTFIKPLSRSLSFWRFYPALLLKCSSISVTLLMSSFVPLISFRNQPSIAFQEVNLLQSLHAFSWLCFLLMTPWITNLPKSNYKYFTIVGLIISAGGSFVIGNFSSHDALTASYTVMGFGYGALASTSDDVIRQWIGIRKWSKIQGTLECLSAFCTGLFAVGVIIVIQRTNDLSYCMFMLTGLQVLVTVIWVFISIMELIVSKRTTYKINDSSWPP